MSLLPEDGMFAGGNDTLPKPTVEIQKPTVDTAH